MIGLLYDSNHLLHYLLRNLTSIIYEINESIININKKLMGNISYIFICYNMIQKQKMAHIIDTFLSNHPNGIFPRKDYEDMIKEYGYYLMKVDNNNRLLDESEYNLLKASFDGNLSEIKILFLNNPDLNINVMNGNGHNALFYATLNNKRNPSTTFYGFLTSFFGLLKNNDLMNFLLEKDARLTQDGCDYFEKGTDYVSLDEWQKTFDINDSDSDSDDKCSR